VEKQEEKAHPSEDGEASPKFAQVSQLQAGVCILNS
jgi:hypothetical protein